MATFVFWINFKMKSIWRNTSICWKLEKKNLYRNHFPILISLLDYIKKSKLSFEVNSFAKNLEINDTYKVVTLWKVAHDLEWSSSLNTRSNLNFAFWSMNPKHFHRDLRLNLSEIIFSLVIPMYEFYVLWSLVSY